MKIYFLLLLIFWSTFLKSQREDRIWYFGGTLSNTTTAGAGLDFNSGSPTPLLNSSMPLTEGSATQCNRVGSLLFYTNGMTVWDKTHAVMMNGTGLGGHTSAEQAALIIPFPNDSSKFYIFGQDGMPTCPGTGLHYSIIDMTLNGGLGGVTSTKGVLLQAGTSELLSGSKHINGFDFWVVTTDFDSLIFYSYKISSSGISPPIKTNLGYNNLSYFKLDFNTKGNQFSFRACPTSTMSGYFVRTVADFNQSTGAVTNPIPLDTAGGNVGAVFSPNDSLFYSVGVSVSNLVLYQYNLKASNIYASRHLIKTFSDSPHLDFKLGPDNKIYASSSLYDSLDIIHLPNKIGTACNYQEKALYLGGRKMRYLLPNKTFELAKYPLLIFENENRDKISIFPNPTSNFITIIAELNTFEFILSNLQGINLIQKKYYTSDKIDLTEVPNGIYFLKIISDYKTYYDKIVVRH